MTSMSHTLKQNEFSDHSDVNNLILSIKSDTDIQNLPPKVIIAVRDCCLGCRMELQLPKINTIVLQDGTSTPFQLSRRRISTDKLPVPSGARLTLTRGQVGDGLYRPTTDFLRKGPYMGIPDPIYNNLHDPHLRHYFHRQDKRNMLKEGNFITDDNEVICSLKDYNTYEEYLRMLKMVANKTYDQIQSAKMEKVMRLQKKGRIPMDVRLVEVMESILEEDSENMRKLLQIEAAKKKQKGETGVEDENQRIEEALYTELDLLSWTAEDRSRLMLYEKQHRHQQNREIYIKEVREQKDRRKQAVLRRKSSTNQRKLLEKIKLSKEAELKRNKTEGQEERFWELPSGEPQCLPPSRPRVKSTAPRSGAARVYGVNASEYFQKLPMIQWTGANDRRTFPQKAKASQESAVAERKADVRNKDLGEPSPGSDRQGLLPLRPPISRPVLRSGAARVYGFKVSEVHQKLPSLDSSQSSDQ